MRLIPTKYQGRLHIIAPGTDDVQGKIAAAHRFGWPDVSGCRMWRIPFLIYCVACWEYFLFEPLIALNLLMIGFIFVGRHRELQAILRGRAVTAARPLLPQGSLPWTRP
jgi:hypothetical protein